MFFFPRPEFLAFLFTGRSPKPRSPNIRAPSPLRARSPFAVSLFVRLNGQIHFAVSLVNRAKQDGAKAPPFVSPLIRAVSFALTSFVFPLFFLGINFFLVNSRIYKVLLYLCEAMKEQPPFFALIIPGLY